MAWLIVSILAFICSPLVVILVKFVTQRAYDRERKTYLLTFPTNLSESKMKAWLRTVSGSLRVTGVGRITGMPTITFETWATDRGLSHRITVPSHRAGAIARQLRLAGVSVEEDKRPTYQWNGGAELGMKLAGRTLSIESLEELSASMLASIDTLEPGQVVVVQWIVAPAPSQQPPAKDRHSKTDAFTKMAILNGIQLAHHDELEDRRKKLQEPNFQAIGRVGAFAKHEKLAADLVERVTSALSSTNASDNHIERYKVRPSKLIRAVNEATTPTFFPAQFSMTELAGVVAWPLGEPMVAGLPNGPARQLYATEDVSRVGRVLGHSNYPGHERPIALDYKYGNFHTFVGGNSGMGKSNLLAVSAAQDMNMGHGVIVIDVSSSESNETLYSRVLNYVPPDRLDDVIILDVNRSRNNPVGFNILDQGDAGTIVDQVTELFTHIYQDTKGVWTKKLLFYGLYTLAEHPGMTFVDLVPLLSPDTDAEKEWARELKQKAKNPKLRQFWKRWESFSESERLRFTQPLFNRIWQLADRPEIYNIVGQSESSFKMEDVLRDNKILLINMAGVSKDTASLIATLFTRALWTAAQTMTPEKTNHLYLDEFQLTLDMPIPLDDMMDRARKHNFELNLATQHLSDKKPEMKSAILNNAGTRIIFRSGATEGLMWATEFGRQYFSPDDISHLPRFQAVAQIATENGTGKPVTIKAMAPQPSTGVAKEAIAISAQKYGRTLEDIDAQIIERRKGTPVPIEGRVVVGERTWDKYE